MKHMTVVIRAELEVPDDWELAEHPAGIQVLKIGDQFVDFDIVPLATQSSAPDAEWSDRNTDLIDKVTDAILELDAELEIHTQH